MKRITARFPKRLVGVASLAALAVVSLSAIPAHNIAVESYEFYWIHPALAQGQGNSGQGNSGQGNSGQGNSGQGNSSQGNSGQGNSGQGNSGQGNSGQGNSGQAQGQGSAQSVTSPPAPVINTPPSLGPVSASLKAALDVIQSLFGGQVGEDLTEDEEADLIGSGWAQ
jgi:PPE-repeat protein